MVAVISSLLVGCKVDLETKINTDNLLSSEQNIVKGDINFEVSSCNDFEDSRKESKSLIELKIKFLRFSEMRNMLNVISKNLIHSPISQYLLVLARLKTAKTLLIRI